MENQKDCLETKKKMEMNLYKEEDNSYYDLRSHMKEILKFEGITGDTPKHYIEVWDRDRNIFKHTTALKVNFMVKYIVSLQDLPKRKRKYVEELLESYGGKKVSKLFVGNTYYNSEEMKSIDMANLRPYSRLLLKLCPLGAKGVQIEGCKIDIKLFIKLLKLTAGTLSLKYGGFIGNEMDSSINFESKVEECVVMNCFPYKTLVKIPEIVERNSNPKFLKIFQTKSLFEGKGLKEEDFPSKIHDGELVIRKTRFSDYFTYSKSNHNH